MIKWIFKDYIDENGTNVILRWLHGLPLDPRLDIQIRIQYLEAVDDLRSPHVKLLHGDCKGLFELRIFSNKIQYRPIGCYGPGKREITLLAGATENGGNFVPKNVCKIALKRKKRISETGRTHEHSFEEP